MGSKYSVPIAVPSRKPPEIRRRVLGIVYRCPGTCLIQKAGFTRKTAQTGAVTMIQRFGSALNLNIHYHMLFLGGIYDEQVKGRLRFYSVKAIPYRVAVGPKQGRKVFALQSLPASDDASLPSAATRPNERWATDMARVWCGEQHRWCALTLVMDCFTRELLGWRLSPTGNAKAAEAALEEALIARYGSLGRTLDDLTIRSDNGLVFTSRRFTRTVYRYGIKQEFIRPHTPQQNGMVERLIRSVKEQCLWLHNFASLDEARQALRKWFRYYNEQRPH